MSLLFRTFLSSSKSLSGRALISLCGVLCARSSVALAAEPALPQNAVALVAPTPVRDEASFLISQAWTDACDKRYEEAVALCDQVWKIPVPPGTPTPGLAPPPFDWRGEARWIIAEVRRAQGRWAEALELYRLNSKTYPRNDGCVRTGAGYQAMMLAEGQCLEHLGRTSEAVESYWPAAMSLEGNVTPRAMRRLVELYTASGQLDVLDAAVAREAKQIPFYTILMMTGQQTEWPPDISTKKRVEMRLANSSVVAFRRIRLLQQAAREGQWSVLLAELNSPTAFSELEEQGSEHQQQEVFEAFATVSKRSQRVLKAALDHEPQNVNLLTALLYCEPLEQRELWLHSSHEGTDAAASDKLHDLMYNGIYTMLPLQFPVPSTPLNLPVRLPRVVGERDMF